jgi:glycolate oxidase subunit GlcD
MKTFFNFLNKNQIILDESELKAYGIDRTNSFESNSSVLLKPINTLEISKIIQVCNQNNIRIIPVGGQTGLSGATLARKKEAILSLEKMNTIIDIDSTSMTVTVESGVILEDLQNELEKHKLYFPLDFAAKGTCQVGGFISTNAGGVKVLKYGMTRDILLGLEVVLPTGEILNLNRKLIKNNSGYKLEQLFCGAEGTLGIVTKATFKCLPLKSNKSLFLIQTDDFKHVPIIFSKIRSSFRELSAFEYLDNISYRAVVSSMPQLSLPYEENVEHLILIETEELIDDLSIFESLADDGLIVDIRIPENSDDFNLFWKIRESVSDAIYLLGNVHANDISVPVKQLSKFLSELKILFESKYSMYKIGVFGHIGDGNLHIYIINHDNHTHFDTDIKKLDTLMFQLISNFSGSISAEHGIGLLKKDALKFRRSEKEIEIMRSIKKLFDPKNILNPSKIFDL